MTKHKKKRADRFSASVLESGEVTGPARAYVERMVATANRLAEMGPFAAYSPFVSFAKKSNGRFLGGARIAASLLIDTPDTHELWNVGHAAFALLEVRTARDFKSRFISFQRSIEDRREVLRRSAADGLLSNALGSPPEKAQRRVHDMEDVDVVSLFWAIADELKKRRDTKFDSDLRVNDMALSCLIEIDNALIATLVNSDGGIAHSVRAANYLADGQVEMSGVDAIRRERRVMARAGAAARYREDPKQAEKFVVYAQYRKWREKPDLFPSKAAFARAMLGICKDLTSDKKMKDWVRDWDRGIGIPQVRK